MQSRANPFSFYSWTFDNQSKAIESCNNGREIYVFGNTSSLDVNLQVFTDPEVNADYVCVSKFKKPYTYEKDYLGYKLIIFGKQEALIHSILACFINIASQFSIGQDIIIQRCRACNLTLPTHIFELSKNILQCSWFFEDELFLYKKSMLGYWKVVQKSLYEAFKDLGADTNYLTDAIFYLLNPYKSYSKDPIVDLVHKGDKIVLSDLYYSLKSAGCTTQ